MRRHKIIITIIIGYVIFGVLGFIAIGSYTSKYNQRLMLSGEAVSLRKTANHVVAEYTDGYKSSEMTLLDFKKHVEMAAEYCSADIHVINRDGIVLASSTWENGTKIENFDIIDFGNSYYNVSHFYEMYENDEFCVYSPISVDYKIAGYVLMCKPLSSIIYQKEAYLRGTYITYIFLMAFSMIIFIIYLFTTYRPMRKIAKAAAAYSDGEYDEKMDIHRSDELGLIADTMSYMAMELDSLESDQRKFVSNISHDFRSPLTSIKGYANAMADGTIPPELYEKYLGVIIFETERLEKLTQNLLEINKIDKKGSFLDITTFALNEFIKRTVMSFEGQAMEKRITFDLTLTEDEIFVNADSAKIDQVMHNLIDNAIKFSDNSSTIYIETTLRRGKVFVSVKDTGIGIPKDSINKVWERFYKTDLSRGKDKKGTGLGLAIVKDIIHAHKENINVISTEGVGTEFIFSLPLANES